MKKICLIFDTAPRYRESVYATIDQSYDCDWYFGDVRSGVKEMDLAHLKNVNHYSILGNINKLYWQSGIIKLLFDNHYDIYIIGFETRAVSKWAFILLAFFFKRKKRIYVWTHGWYGKESIILRLMKRFMFNHIAGTFLYGNYARSLMIDEGIDGNKLFVIHNSLHYDQQKLLRDIIPPSRLFNDHFNNCFPVIIFIGRLTKVKRLDMLLSAVDMLSKHDEFYNIVLIGDGVEKDNLINQAKQLGLMERIWFYGGCYDEMINAEFIINADLCVSPGNVGLTAIHSLSLGCPVITHSSFEWQMPEFEAIKKDVTGDFFERDDVESLAQTISKWFDTHRKNREEVRLACYHEVDTQWNPYFQIDVIKNVIK